MHVRMPIAPEMPVASSTELPAREPPASMASSRACGGCRVEEHPERLARMAAAAAVVVAPVAVTTVGVMPVAAAVAVAAPAVVGRRQQARPAAAAAAVLAYSDSMPRSAFSMWRLRAEQAALAVPAGLAVSANLAATLARQGRALETARMALTMAGLVARVAAVVTRVAAVAARAVCRMASCGSAEA